MKHKVSNSEALRLLFEGSQALTDIEQAGVRVDTKYVGQAITQAQTEEKDFLKKMESDDTVMKPWRKRYGQKTNITSREQLATVLFKDLGIESVGKTEKGRDRTDVEALDRVDLPYVKNFLAVQKLKKVMGTYFAGVKKHSVKHPDGFWYVHPTYLLNTAVTYRSSSTQPNFQNIPTRDPSMAARIRKCYLPHPGHRIVEVDFGQIEVRVAYCVVGETKVETIDGPQTIVEVCDRVQSGEEVFVYGHDLKKGRLSVGKVLEGDISGRKKEVWKLTLDNGEIVKATPNHKFLLRSGEYRQLKDLKTGDSLMPFYKTNKKKPWGTVYTKIYLNNGSSMMAHNLIALDLFGVDVSAGKKVVHHWNGKGTDNRLDNIEVMSRRRHMRIHSIQGWMQKGMGNRNQWQSSKEGREYARSNAKVWWENLESWEREEIGKRIREGIARNGGRKGKNNSMYGKRQTRKTKRLISESKTGIPTGKCWNKGLTKETHPSIKRMGDDKLGTTLPPETKRKISEAGKGKKKPESFREYMRNRVVSEETKQKLSEARKQYLENKPDETCLVCNKTFRTITNTHLKHKHKITKKEYLETYNHKVVSVEFCGYEDVYNLTVEGFHNYALEAGIIAKNCLHKDPTMGQYLHDPTTDMHRDTAAELFFLTYDQVIQGKKTVRHSAKNEFVFPEFYGSVYFQCAKNIWDSMVRGNWTVPGTDKPLVKHLRKNGIKECGDCIPGQSPGPNTFERHVKNIEDLFWNKRFPVYTAWKRKFYSRYLRNGGFDTVTGFRINGVFSRNDVINYPVQGPAFHCLLWVLIELSKWMRKYKLKSKIIGEIHDSAILSVDPREEQTVIDKITTLMTKELPKAWKWIICPIEVEVECTGVDESWYTKKLWTLQGSEWGLKT